MFASPVDPERDNCLSYFKIIEHPMDFGTVRSKLESDQYKSVEQWKEDVHLIFENSYKFNTRQSLISTLAKQLQQIFNELTETITSNPKMDWLIKLDQLKTELNQMYKNAPKDIIQQRKVTRRQSEIQTRERPPSPSPSKSKKTPKPDVPDEEEVTRLISDVNNLENAEHINKVVDLIKEKEPRLRLSNGEIEIDVSKLSKNTLTALRKLVDSFKK
ncbi:Bromodomain containing protein [Histomonas meleagridis]|uniref:Bromodomain containing protein n=1 Tax=Histomonas meleagridis TaxID=135588 RepID=UPI003559F5F4|nr:Bromodomain containing protein [Histomonas meleagridis]KAH0796460.1 Bromodomain containing protein [Histomonas meleagridis]